MTRRTLEYGNWSDRRLIVFADQVTAVEARHHSAGPEIVVHTSAGAHQVWQRPFIKEGEHTRAYFDEIEAKLAEVVAQVQGVGS